jgi:hypothetical protein
MRGGLEAALFFFGEFFVFVAAMQRSSMFFRREKACESSQAP